MNLSDITTQPYILALFKRDDGTRFLLGLGAYEFKDSQQHFIANTMVNDVVDMQGTDGALLAGQVRRASVQSFDGYVGDGSVIKSTVEQYRKDFIAYFQKNHFYTVVYIFSDGTAIQRKRGYIIDSPEVKELYQMAPEYHIALNFEDVNYYKYAENASGDEIYSNTANITSKITTTGGLIWSNLSSVPITGEGTSFTLYGTLAESNLQRLQLKGQTTQHTCTGKNLFQAPSSADSVYQLTYTKNSNNSITITSNAGASGAAYALLTISGLTASTQYTISFTSDKSTVPIRTRIDRTWGTTTESSGSGYTFTSGSSTTQIAFYSIYGNYSESPITISNIQIEAGSSASTFEPYCGGIASPNPDYPQTVQTVSGTQTITVSDGDSQTQTFSVRLGSLELCKIGTYQDYIYNSNGDWFVHKKIKKLDVSSLGGWYLNNNTNFRTPTGVSDIVFPADNNTVGAIISANYTAQTANSIANGDYDYAIGLGASSYLTIRNKDISTVAAFETYLSNNQIYAYVALAIATDTQITDANLISDLEALLGADTYRPSTAFEITATNNLSAWLSVSAHSGSSGVVWDNIGATWEEGGEGGDSFVTVDSITDVFPTITIIGAAYNPKITNITTGQVLQYTGNVASGQKLVIDVQQKTAKLSGTSVITNVSGDWLYLKPGVNRIAYTIDNATVNYATIEWQEITG